MGRSVGWHFFPLPAPRGGGGGGENEGKGEGNLFPLASRLLSVIAASLPSNATAPDAQREDTRRESERALSHRCCRGYPAAETARMSFPAVARSGAGGRGVSRTRTLTRRFAAKTSANTWYADKQRAKLREASADFAGALRVGGAAPQLNALFRRVFASRLVPPAVASKLGLRHTRGLLLHGPPGTGKTLIARRLASLLSAKPAQLVSGPEIFHLLLGAPRRP